VGAAVSATPGPWWTDVHGNVLGPGGGLVAFPGIAFGYDEKANARLIAAAPELLAALIRCEACTTNDGVGQQARAAIAKATEAP
jgi:hypothetical protein